MFAHNAFSAEELADCLGDQRVSLCIPARNEAETIGTIVELARSELVERTPLLHEIVVMDDHSDDRTAEVASAAGARVARCEDLLTDYAKGPGKGQAMWKSVYAAKGDLIVWCDADIRNFGVQFIIGLVGPLICHRDVSFVKGYYERPLDGKAGAGGRVTELVARPLFSLFRPELAQFIQPLSGEYGGRRSALERLPFTHGYGVETGLLCDLAKSTDLSTIAQVDLGTRVHRNRDLDGLAVQSQQVMATLLHRSIPDLVAEHSTLVRPGKADVAIDVSACPPLIDVPEYTRRATD